MERFSRALRLRWLWLSWVQPQKAWVGMDLPVDEVDKALFAAATVVTVRNGRKARFWMTSWLGGQSPALLFPLLFQHSRRKNRSVAEALTNDQWIRDIAHDLTPTLIQDFFNLWRLVESEEIDLNSLDEDVIVWTRLASGEYTAKSAYDLQFEGSTSSATTNFI